MEINHKQQNRDKWRASTRRGRGRGKGAQGGQPDEAALESNHNRFQESEDEGSPEQTVHDLPSKQSQGADLQQLLAEAEQFYAQAHHRYRSFIEAVDLEPPAVDVATLEQELVIDPDLLIRSLLPLPLPELLRLSVPQVFLSEGNWDHPPKVVIPQQTSCDTQQGLASSHSPVGADTHHHQQQQQQQQQQQERGACESLTAQAREQQDHTPKQHAGASHVVLPPQFRGRQHHPNTASAPESSAQPQSSAVQSTAPSIGFQRVQTAATSKQLDDTDELLDLLLSGRDAPQTSSQVSTVAARGLASVNSNAHSRAGANTTQPPATRLPAQPSSASEPVSSKDSQQGQPSGRGMQQVQSAAATAAIHRQPLATKPASAVIDDELQALLGLGGSSGPTAGASRSQVQSTPAAATSKGSLEEWLDKF